MGSGSCFRRYCLGKFCWLFFRTMAVATFHLYSDTTRRESGVRRVVPSRGSRGASIREEQQRLFGFNVRAGAKHKSSKTHSTSAKKTSAPRKSLWSRDSICLRCHNQDWIPSTEEKVQLAASGLSLKRLSFIQDGDENHIKDVIYEAFPQLMGQGGVDILRPGEQSRTLMLITPPPSGMTIPYLKDVLNQSKIYLRPSIEDIISWSTSRGIHK